MIKEFALDPGTLQQWNTFRHFALGIGYDFGRILARYPKHWMTMAAQQVETVQDQNDKKKLQAWLYDCAKPALTHKRSGAVYDKEQCWLMNAKAEHERQPFDAIVSVSESSINPPVLKLDDLDDGHLLWKQTRQVYISRNAAEVSQCVKKMLRHGSIIRFIDPYFKADPDQVQIILECLSECARLPNCDSIVVEIHVDGAQVGPSTAAFIESTLLRSWPNRLASPRIMRWIEKYLHNRMILTNNGGFIFGDSLRHDSDRPDQVTLLERQTWQHWWNRHDAVLNATHIALA